MNWANWFRGKRPNSNKSPSAQPAARTPAFPVAPASRPLPQPRSLAHIAQPYRRHDGQDGFLRRGITASIMDDAITWTSDAEPGTALAPNEYRVAKVIIDRKTGRFVIIWNATSGVTGGSGSCEKREAAKF